MKNKFLFRGLVLGEDNEYSHYVYGGIYFDEEDEEYLILNRDHIGRSQFYLPAQDSIEQLIEGEWKNILQEF